MFFALLSTTVTSYPREYAHLRTERIDEKRTLAEQVETEEREFETKLRKMRESFKEHLSNIRRNNAARKRREEEEMDRLRDELLRETERCVLLPLREIYILCVETSSLFTVYACHQHCKPFQLEREFSRSLPFAYEILPPMLHVGRKTNGVRRLYV